MQPPSGGCVLKHTYITQGIIKALAAAFGRLCVETESELVTSSESEQQPSGGCVLKLMLANLSLGQSQAAAFGRLCVETTSNKKPLFVSGCSRLRAAVC